MLYAVEEKRYSGSEGTGIGWIDPSAPVNSKAALEKTIQKSLEGMNFQKHISLLGSTGSIGTQTLEIIDACPNNFVIDALSAGTNVELLSQQIMRYTPKIASVATAEAATALKERLVALQCTNMPEIVFGEEGIIAAATIASADTVVTGIVGAAGLQPTIEAIKCGKDIALANKETLISGGPVINPLVEQYGVNMVRLLECRASFLFVSIVPFELTHCTFGFCSCQQIVNIVQYFNVYRAYRKVDYVVSY
jgi:1-deoxy-D-xylulose-5-phosphate reductoisomerase